MSGEKTLILLRNALDDHLKNVVKWHENEIKRVLDGQSKVSLSHLSSSVGYRYTESLFVRDVHRKGSFGDIELTPEMTLYLKKKLINKLVKFVTSNNESDIKLLSDTVAGIAGNLKAASISIESVIKQIVQLQSDVTELASRVDQVALASECKGKRKNVKKK